jgi:hypothetical protein
MTENPPRSVTPLPESIKAKLRAANARHIAICDGPNGSIIEFWAAAHGAILLAQRHPDGNGFEMFRPFDSTNSTAALIDALRHDSRVHLISGRKPSAPT